MLNLRVPVAAAYIPKIRNSKRLPNGCNEKENQPSCVLNQDNIRMVTSFHQLHNATYQFLLNEREALTRTYSTYSTELVKEKKLQQKIGKNNVTNIRSNKPEVANPETIKIPIESEESGKSLNKLKTQTTEKYPINVDKTDLTESSLLNSSQPQPVSLQNDSQAVVLKQNPLSQPVSIQSSLHSEKMKTNLLSTKKISSLDYPKINYADLSLVKVPIPLHDNDQNLFGSRMGEGLDKIRFYTLRLENSYFEVQQRGKIWYITKQEKLYKSIIYQEILKGNLTLQPIADRITVLLAEKDPEKKVEKSVEKAKEVSKTVTDLIIDKTKALIAALKEIIEKAKQKEKK